MRCSKCGGENPGAKRFCEDCGTSLSNRCPRCGVDNQFEKKFGGDCAAPFEIATRASKVRTALLQQKGDFVATLPPPDR